MQQIRPEIPEIMAAAPGLAADLVIELAEIANINREFLRLLASPAVAENHSLLGLDGGVLGALRSLSPAQLDRIAAAPQLLAEFSPLPGARQTGASDAPTPRQLAQERGAVADVGGSAYQDSQWEQQVQGFAQRLLVCLWQSARHSKRITALNAGLTPESLAFLAAQSFTVVSRHCAEAGFCLRARFALHPRFWPDLIRSVRIGNSEQQAASRLSLLPLSISQAGLKKNHHQKLPGLRYRR
jgi:hypothetical protein